MSLKQLLVGMGLLCFLIFIGNNIYKHINEKTVFKNDFCEVYSTAFTKPILGYKLNYNDRLVPGYATVGQSIGMVCVLITYTIIVTIIIFLIIYCLPYSRIK